MEKENSLKKLFSSFGNEKNRIDFRIIKESEEKYSKFLYNSLFYTFYPEINMYVNQYGYGMPYEKAINLAKYMGYDEKDLTNNLQKN